MALNLPRRSAPLRPLSLDEIGNSALSGLLDLLNLYVQTGRDSHKDKGLCDWATRGGSDVRTGAFRYNEVRALHQVLGIFGWPLAHLRTVFGADGWNPKRQYIAERAALYVRGTLLLRGVPLPPMPHLDDIARGMNLPHFQDITAEPDEDLPNLMQVGIIAPPVDRVSPPVVPAEPVPTEPKAPKAGTQAARVLRALQEGRNTLGRIAAYANPCTETSASARIRELRSRGYTITVDKFRVFGTRSYHYTYTLED